jgi:hypothetical protein
MRQRTTVLICLACLVMAAKAGADESPDGIATMRMQLECGWLEQLSAGSDEFAEVWD